MKGITTKAILHTKRQLSDGSYPIHLRVTFERKRKYYPLKIKATTDEWEKINDPKTKGELRKLRLFINGIEKKADDVLYDLERQNISFTFDKFERFFFDSKNNKTVFALFDIVITELQEENRIGTALSYRDAKKCLMRFRKNKDLNFSDIDAKFLKKFEYFILQTLSVTTVGIYMRSLRVIYNRAIKENIIKQDNYPFSDYRIPTAATAKRALHKADVQKIFNYSILPINGEWQAKNYWLLSYLTQGMNFTDIAYLKNKNLVDGRITYVRTKTKRTAKESKIISIKITPILQEIIGQLRSNKTGLDDYLFPILTSSMDAAKQKATIRQFIKTTNKYLARIGKHLGLPLELTTYVARHTYATVLKRNGAPLSVISESLGHHNERTTQVYLDSFENSVLDAQNENLL
jgi:integrase